MRRKSKYLLKLIRIVSSNPILQRVVVNYFYFLHTLQNLSKFEIKRVKDNSLLSYYKS